MKQRAVRVMLLAKSLTSEEVGHQLIVCLSTEYGIGSNLLQAAMRERFPASIAKQLSPWEILELSRDRY